MEFQSKEILQGWAGRARLSSRIRKLAAFHHINFQMIHSFNRTIWNIKERKILVLKTYKKNFPSNWFEMLLESIQFQSRRLDMQCKTSCMLCATSLLPFLLLDEDVRYENWISNSNIQHSQASTFGELSRKIQQKASKFDKMKPMFAQHVIKSQINL